VLYPVVDVGLDRGRIVNGAAVGHQRIVFGVQQREKFNAGERPVGQVLKDLPVTPTVAGLGQIWTVAAGDPLEHIAGGRQ
jgi:hypothetical protein